MSTASPQQFESRAPIRIAFCITVLDPGGAERALLEIVKRLDKNKWEPHVYCLSNGGELVGSFEEEGIPVTCYGATNPRDMRVFLWLKRELKKFAPQLVQGFMFHGNIVSRVAGYLAGIPLRMSGHRVAEKQKGWHLKVDRLTKPFVQHHVCVSQGVAEFVKQRLHLKAEQISVIGNGIDPLRSLPINNTIREELGLPESTDIILAVGRLHRQKGFDVLLEAMSIAACQCDDIHLLLVGSGTEKENYEQLIARLGLESSVTMTGYRADIPELMSESTIYVLSSRWEGMPNVLLDAMQWSLPVIATDVEGVSELVQDQVNGRVVKPSSAKELGKAIHELLNNKQARNVYAEKSKALVYKEFTWNHVALAYDDLYSTQLKKLDPDS